MNNPSGEKRAITVHALEISVFSCLLLLLLNWPSADLIDLRLQYLFFDKSNTSWMISPHDRGLIYILLYNLPKALYVIFGLAALHWLYRTWREEGWHSRQSRLLMVILIGATIPLFVGWLKESTGITCPDQESLFGGVSPHTSIWRNAINGVTYYNFHCWPAGHASGGFGLMACRLLAPTEFQGWVWMAPGMTLGWITGLYQMARGQHFLSHTIVTMLIALIATSIAMLYARKYLSD